MLKGTDPSTWLDYYKHTYTRSQQENMNEMNDSFNEREKIK